MYHVRVWRETRRGSNMSKRWPRCNQSIPPLVAKLNIFEVLRTDCFWDPFWKSWYYGFVLQISKAMRYSCGNEVQLWQWGTAVAMRYSCGNEVQLWQWGTAVATRCSCGNEVQLWQWEIVRNTNVCFSQYTFVLKGELYPKIKFVLFERTVKITE